MRVHNSFLFLRYGVICVSHSHFQVSRLVIIHEEGEEGQEMPDLVRPVQAVSKAVDNLVKVKEQ